MDMLTETTNATPVPDGQDSADAIGPDITATTTADRLAHARQRHADAVANHGQAQQRADRAAALRQQAEANHAALVARASSGETVDQIDIRRARTAVNEATDAADHCKLVATGAETLMNRAHIAALQAEADHLAAGYHESVASRISAAEEVDRQWAALQAALTSFKATALNVSLASTAVRLFNSGIDAHAASNAVLAAMNQSDRPCSIRPADVALKAARAAFVSTASGRLTEETFTSLEWRERSLHGLIAPPVSIDQPIRPRHPGATFNGLVPAGWKPTSPDEAAAAERYDAISRRGG